MKRIFSFFAMLTLLAGFTACNSGGSGSGEAYTIKMRLNKGDQFNNNIKMNTEMTAAVMTMKMNMAFDTKFEVLESTDTGKVLQLTYTKADAHMDMGSLGSIGNAADSILQNTYKKMVGKSIRMTLTPDYKISSVSGFDSLVVSDMADEMSRQTVEKMFSKDQLNNTFGMYFNLYPSKPVKVGDTWESETSMSLADINMKVKIKYKLASVKNGVADIDVDGVIDGSGTMNKGSNSMNMNMSGTQKGTMSVNLSDGYLINGGYKMDVKADMEMMGQKIPMTLKADYTVSGK